MRFRAVLSLASLAALVAAIVVLWVLPQYSAIAFYVVLAWMFVWLALLYLPGPRRASDRGSPPAAAASSGPLPPGPTQPSSALGFCIYCAAPVEAGAVRCPACGHSLPHFA